MNIKKCILLSLFILFLSKADAQTDYIGNVKDLPNHPRLLMFKGQEELIRKHFVMNKELATLHSQILAESDRLIVLPVVKRILVGRRLLAVSREALRRIYYLAYSWRMTGNKKYLIRGEQELIAISSFSDWHADHFLDVAEMTMAASIGYDWFYQGLSSSSRNIVKDAILNKGLKPSMDNHYNGWLTGTNNWNQVCNSGISYGALAIWEDNPLLAKTIVNRAIGSLPLSMAGYSPDGAYPEGYGYWGYGTNFNVMFLDAIEKLFNSNFNLENQKGFLNTAAFLENMTGPSGNGFNFSDAALKSELQPNPAMFWIAGKLNDPALLWEEKPLFDMKNVSENVKNRFLPSVITWASRIDMAAIHSPDNIMWVGRGKTPVAMMRTSWTAPDAIYVAMKGGSSSTNHAHMDAGSFILEADGIRWAMDFGAEDYTTLEAHHVDLWNSKKGSARWDVFRYKNQSHNTITVNDQPQEVDGQAPISYFSKNPQWMNAITDLTGVYKGQLLKASRGIALIDKSVVVVRDELTALGQDAAIRWNLLTPARAKMINDREVELDKNGKKIIIRVLEPAAIKMRTWDTQPKTSYESKNPGTVFVGFEFLLPANSTKALTVVFIPERSFKLTIPAIPHLDQWPGR